MPRQYIVVPKFATCFIFYSWESPLDHYLHILLKLLRELIDSEGRARPELVSPANASKRRPGMGRLETLGVREEASEICGANSGLYLLDTHLHS